jgi:subtilisin family serine protease
VERNIPNAQLAEVQANATVGIDRIDQRFAPLDNSFWWTPDDDPVNVYVVDSGIDPRTRFGNRLVEQISFATTAAGDPITDYTDFGLPLNNTWHGTKVAMLAAGDEYGVARSAKIVNVRYLGGNSDGWDAVVKAVDWITARAKERPWERHVANASFADSRWTDDADRAFRASVAAGVFWVFAAGNSAKDSCDYFPAKLGRQLRGAITVGAMNPRDDRAIASYNQGRCVEVFAPSFVPWGPASETGGPCNLTDLGGCFTGTSAAAPFVTGAVATFWADLMLSTNAQIEDVVKGIYTENVVLDISCEFGCAPNFLLYVRPGRIRAAGS